MKAGCRIEYKGLKGKITYVVPNGSYHILLDNEDYIQVKLKNISEVKLLNHEINVGDYAFYIHNPKDLYKVLFKKDNYLLLDTLDIPTLVNIINYRNIKDLTHG